MKTLASELLEILVCPATHQKLELADTDLLNFLERQLEESQLVTVGGSKILIKPQAALVRQDKQVCYLIQDGIPMLLIEQGIKL